MPRTRYVAGVEGASCEQARWQSPVLQLRTGRVDLEPLVVLHVPRMFALAVINDEHGLEELTQRVGVFLVP